MKNSVNAAACRRCEVGASRFTEKGGSLPPRLPAVRAWAMGSARAHGVLAPVFLSDRRNQPNQQKRQRRKQDGTKHIGQKEFQKRVPQPKRLQHRRLKQNQEKMHRGRAGRVQKKREKNRATAPFPQKPKGTQSQKIKENSERNAVGRQCIQKESAGDRRDCGRTHAEKQKDRRDKRKTQIRRGVKRSKFHKKSGLNDRGKKGRRRAGRIGQRKLPPRPLRRGVFRADTAKRPCNLPSTRRAVQGLPCFCSQSRSRSYCRSCSHSGSRARSLFPRPGTCRRARRSLHGLHGKAGTSAVFLMTHRHFPTDPKSAHCEQRSAVQTAPPRPPASDCVCFASHGEPFR